MLLMAEGISEYAQTDRNDLKCEVFSDLSGSNLQKKDGRTVSLELV